MILSYLAKIWIDRWRRGQLRSPPQGPYTAVISNIIKDNVDVSLNTLDVFKGSKGLVG